jgi:hypothetical protein
MENKNNIKLVEIEKTCTYGWCPGCADGSCPHQVENKKLKLLLDAANRLIEECQEPPAT